MFSYRSTCYQTSYIILMCFLWAGMLLQNVAVAFFIHIPGCSELGEFFVPGVIIFFSFLSLPTILRHVKIWDILFYCIITSFYMMNYSWHPENSVILDDLKDGFLYNTLLLYFFGVVLDFDALKKYLYKVSLATVYISFVWYFILDISGGIDFNDWSGGMSTAYAMLPHLMFVVWQFLEKPSWKDGLALFIGVVFMLSMGNRGSLVALLAFVVLFLLVFKKYTSHRSFKRILILALAAIFYFFINGVVLLFSVFVLLIGGNTRVIDKFSDSEELIDDSGRKAIREKLIDDIQIHGGHGFAGDQYLVGTYSHNLFFEWAVSFGLVVTCILVLILILLIVKAYRKSPTHDEKMFVLLLLCCMLKLMFSGTYLADNFFFVIIGFLVHQCRIKSSYVYEPNNYLENV